MVSKPVLLDVDSVGCHRAPPFFTNAAPGGQTRHRCRPAPKVYYDSHAWEGGNNLSPVCSWRNGRWSVAGLSSVFRRLFFACRAASVRHGELLRDFGFLCLQADVENRLIYKSATVSGGGRDQNMVKPPNTRVPRRVASLFAAGPFVPLLGQLLFFSQRRRDSKTGEGVAVSLRGVIRVPACARAGLGEGVAFGLPPGGDNPVSPALEPIMRNKPNLKGARQERMRQTNPVRRLGSEPGIA
jgi:hypothetical protein